MRGWLALVLGLFAGAALADGAVHEFQLDNGLKLVVKEDHRAPVMVSQVWYKVGSSYEHDGITGISHVLEHMMFKGTAAHPAGEFSQIISENGGRENAFTSQDYTAYFQTMEKNRLPVSFELEADRMRNLTLPEKEFRKEVQVVMEERRMRTEDDPQSLTYEQFNAAAFVNSPYRTPVIGWMDDLENLRVDDLRRWYRKWYAPNNATLVVVGDVDPDAVYAQARKYFGALRPSEPEAVKPRHEIEQLGRKDIRVKAPAKLPYLIMGYKVPVLKTVKAADSWEPYALEVLAGVLDQGSGARLSSELVRGSAVAASAGASYDAWERLESLFVLSGTPSTNHGVAELEKALLEQVRKLQQTPVGKDELERVKAQIRADKVYEQDSIFYQAMQIGILETVGLGWRESQRYLERIEAVTAEQVQAVARKYLIEDHLTVAQLVPQPIEPGKEKTPHRAGVGGHVR
ncbi:MAG TPA: insulinase family protein [Gammaproteobacteria bacterium]|nr:insulinase family protein [Gammaproteobacteria bacterium]